MQKINTADGLFVDGNPSTGALGTVLTAAWLNMVQAELISVLTAAGITVDGAKSDQLTTAIQTLLRGKATVNVAGGASVTLTAAQYGMPILILTGALTANINLIFPAISGAWIVRNQTTGAFSVTCKTAAGTGVAVSQGFNNALWGDGTNIYAAQTDWASIALTGTSTAPTPAAGTNTTQLANMAALQFAVQTSAAIVANAAGTADALTASYTPAITALSNGLTLYVRAGAANASATPTFTPNSGTIAAKAIVKGAGSALAAGDIAGAGHWLELQYDLALDKWVLLNPALGISSSTRQIQPITASVSANALTLNLNPTSLDFRASTLNSGAVNTRSVAAAISLVVPSGATLGTVNGQSARLAVIAIDNAGTVELAVANLSGGVNLDETTLISTTAISAAATSASTVYSTTARAAVPFRVVGFIDIAETTAGTWAAAPTVIQGQGGQALSAMQSLGYGQTWQNMTGSRAFGTTYYNTTGRPLAVMMTWGGSVTSAGNFVNVFVNGVQISTAGCYGTSLDCVMVIVPAGQSYSFSNNANSSMSSWYELR